MKLRTVTQVTADGVVLRVIHDQLADEATSKLYGGRPMILSDLKTLLETAELLDTRGSLRYSQATAWQEVIDMSLEALLATAEDAPPPSRETRLVARVDRSAAPVGSKTLTHSSTQSSNCGPTRL
jgi:hypothetical protein